MSFSFSYQSDEASKMMRSQIKKTNEWNMYEDIHPKKKKVWRFTQFISRKAAQNNLMSEEDFEIDRHLSNIFDLAKSPTKSSA